MNLFMDVFPDLNLPDDIKRAVKDAVIERITMNSKKDAVKIILQSNHIIEKQTIYELIRILKNKLFPNDPNANVIIIEKFKLSSQYTARTFYKEYKDSIYTELNRNNALLFSLYNGSDVSFTDDNSIVITTSQNVIAKELESELIGYFHKVFAERAGLTCDILIDYVITDNTEKELKKEALFREKVIKIENNLRKIEDDKLLKAGKDIIDDSGIDSKSSEDKASDKKEVVKNKDKEKSLLSKWILFLFIYLYNKTEVKKHGN